MAYRKYKLGDLVEQYDEINLSGEFADINDLQGINSNKYFQECKSNKNDIDLYRYRICRHGMFSYNRATSRNGEKISIALRTGGDCIVSPSYYCFRVKDEYVLCPEYLDIWFKRPVFDRYARFNSWGSATEFFTFDDFCATEIMLPSISEQRKIIHDYQVITDRIELLRKMNEKLETVCNTYFDSITKVASQRGSGHLEDYINFGNGKARPSTIGDIPVYGGNGIMSYTNEYNEENVAIIGRVGAYCGSVFVEENCCWVSDNAIVANSKVTEDEYFDYCLLKRMNLYSHHVGTGQQLLTQSILNAISCAAYTKDEICRFNQTVKSIFKNIRHYGAEINKLEKLLLILLSSLAVEMKSEVSA